MKLMRLFLGTEKVVKLKRLSWGVAMLAAIFSVFPPVTAHPSDRKVYEWGVLSVNSKANEITVKEGSTGHTLRVKLQSGDATSLKRYLTDIHNVAVTSLVTTGFKAGSKVRVEAAGISSVNGVVLDIGKEIR